MPRHSVGWESGKTLYYELLHADGTVAIARTSAGVAEVRPTCYGAEITYPAAFKAAGGTIIWDDGERYAQEDITPVEMIAAAVWASASRTLTSMGTLAGDVAAAVWAAATRTLTTVAASVLAGVSGSTITIVRGDDVEVMITGLGSLVGRTKLWVTAKRQVAEKDEDALFQIIEGEGLVILDGADAPAEAGSLTVTDEAAGTVVIRLAAAQAALLPLSSGSVYDAQARVGGKVRTRALGVLKITGDVTRATS